MPLSEKLLLKPVLPLRALNAGHFVAKSSWKHPERTVDHYVLIFVRQGTFGMWEDEGEFILEPGQALVLWPGRMHGGIDVGTGQEHYWIHFESKGKECTAQNAQIQVPKLVNLGRPNVLTELFRRYLDDQDSGRLSQVSADLLLAQMLCELSESETWTSDQSGSLASLASRTKTYIREHFREPISTSSVAAALDCSPSYLGKALRVVYNTTAVKFIHEMRIHEARSQLYYTHKPIDQIAHECGFQDTAYMRRVFRQVVGMSPMAFRKLYAREYVTIID